MSDKLEEFRLKVAKFPDNLLFRFSYAQALSSENYTTEAVEQLNLCVRHNQDWMMAFLLKGKLELKLGKKEEATFSFSKTIELAKMQFHDDPLNEAQELLNSLQ